MTAFYKLRNLKTLLRRLTEEHANNELSGMRDSRYVTNPGYSGDEPFIVSRFRCTTEKRQRSPDVFGAFRQFFALEPEPADRFGRS